MTHMYDADVAAWRLTRTLLELASSLDGGDYDAAFSGAIHGAATLVGPENLVGALVGQLFLALGELDVDPLVALQRLEDEATILRLDSSADLDEQ